MPIDFKTDETNDLKLEDETTGVDIEEISGRDALAQVLNNRLQIAKSNWVFNEDLGLDYTLIQRNPIARDREVQRVIRETPGVANITNYHAEFDRETRFVNITVHVKTTTGESIELTPII